MRSLKSVIFLALMLGSLSVSEAATLEIPPNIGPLLTDWLVRVVQDQPSSVDLSVHSIAVLPAGSSAAVRLKLTDRATGNTNGYSDSILEISKGVPRFSTKEVAGPKAPSPLKGADQLELSEETGPRIVDWLLRLAQAREDVDTIVVSLSTDPKVRKDTVRLMLVDRKTRAPLEYWKSTLDYSGKLAKMSLEKEADPK